MDILFLTIPVALVLALVFLALFIMSVRKGQFEDLETPSFRILLDDKDIKGKNNESKSTND